MVTGLFLRGIILVGKKPGIVGCFHAGADQCIHLRIGVAAIQRAACIEQAVAVGYAVDGVAFKNRLPGISRLGGGRQ